MSESKKQTSISLKKAKTSIETILKMLDEDKYCIDIIQQILAVQGLLKSSTEKLIKNHLNTCFIDGMNTTDINKKEALIEELAKVIKLNNKSA